MIVSQEGWEKGKECKLQLVSALEIEQSILTIARFQVAVIKPSCSL